MRKLASVVRIRSIEPIVGADAIELARIAGWQCVVKKGEFRSGDLALYLEIDSVPPDIEAFRWLWASKSAPTVAVPRPASFRIRTLRLRGALSQGLLQPLQATLAACKVQVGAFDDSGDDVNEGDDLSLRCGVTRYEPPAPAGMGQLRGPFPSLVPKTDETRVQSFPSLLDELRGLPFVATVKIDGTSATFLIDPGDDSFHVCSRNHSVSEGENLYWYVARKHKIEEALRKAPHLVVQGEIAGPGIQKNPLGLADKGLFVFSIFDLRSARWFDDDELVLFCECFDLQPVPRAFVGDAFDETVESLLIKAEGKYEGTHHEREGIVIRPRDNNLQSTILGGRLSFKAISNRFLLAEKD